MPHTGTLPHSPAANDTATPTGDHPTLQRRARALLTEARRALAIWWRKNITLSQCRRPRAAAERKGPGGTMGSLGVLSWVTFFAQAKKVIKKTLPRAQLCAARCRKAMEFKPAECLCPPQRGGLSFLRSFLCASQRNEPKKRAGDTCGFSGSSLSRRAGAAALALWERHPIPYRQRPARFDQNASTAPLRSFAVSSERSHGVCRRRSRRHALVRRGSKSVGGILSG